MVMMSYENDLGLCSENDYYSSICRNQQELIKTIKLFKKRNDKTVIVHYKLTGFFPFSTLRKLSSQIKNRTDYIDTIFAVKNIFRGNKIIDGTILKHFDASERKYLLNGIEKIREAMENVEKSDLQVLVDAEYTDMNEGINAITMAMIMLYNVEVPTVGLTFQCYLKNSLNSIMQNLNIIEEFNLCWNCKFVRGAYMLSERQYSDLNKVPNPVFDSYEETNSNYDKIVEMIFNYHFSKKYSILLATHNINSIRKACKLLLQTNRHTGSFKFGQLMGMSDHISLQLGSLNFPVYKSSPYGNVEDTIPYLVRRFYENSSIFGNVKNDVVFIRKEFFRRLNPLSLKN
ncbi:hydroxyproline dehydrogenase-like [Octopus sinensis]|uniref:Proline dehydrogenase n=1 Tax=Octopus sinensis TaxID=2607531 RepID=A0A6P7U9R9_9MOLL|nr:hydroxyproline dehydrogenase-like [Octopus sinensis]